jgi:two-component system sensor histidine kinase SenX3
VIVVAAALIGVVVGAVIGALFVRRKAVHAIAELSHQLDPGEGAFPEAGLHAALDRLAKVVVRLQATAGTGQASLERLGRALDGLPIGVVVTDERGMVVLRNAAARHFLGVRHADVLVDEAVGAHLRGAVAGRAGRQTLELYGPPKRTVVVNAVPVETGAGSTAVLATIEDVTERSRLEAMRTDFVANISHELRTPVGALAVLAEALVGEDEVDVVNRLAEKMVFEAHRVGRIIEDLLELSRIELGEPAHHEVVSVGLIIAEAVERVRPLAEKREITIDVKEPSRRMNAIGERRQLVSALANLVENGVKYSDPGSAVAVLANSDGTWVEFVVSDQGIGIPSRDLDRIFERFYRVDRGRSRETGGTGLGLAIVRHVATNHGGTVSVRSHEGAGSTFTLRIPAGPGPVAVSISGMKEAG